MQSSLSDTCFGKEVLPRLVVSLGVDRAPVRLGEHEAVVLPQRAGGAPLLFLNVAVGQEQIDQRAGDRDCAAAGLRLHVVEHEATALALRTPAGVARAVRGTRRRAGELVPSAALLAWRRLVVARTAPVRVATVVLPRPALQAPSNAERAHREVDQRPPEPSAPP